MSMPNRLVAVVAGATSNWLADVRNTRLARPDAHGKYLNDFLVPMFSPVSICFAEMPGGTVIELVEPPLGKPVPAAAFNGRRIAFLLTQQRDLIELLEGSGA
jgi:hypothetical protein